MQDDSTRSVARASIRARRASYAAWIAAAAGGLGWYLLPAPFGQGLVSISRIAGMGLFAAFLLLSLTYTLRIPARRTAAALLLAAVGTWAMGLVAWALSGPREQLHAATPTELFFVASYLLMGVFLVRDSHKPDARPLGSWLEVGVMAGAAAMAVGVMFASPTIVTGEASWSRLVISMAYPTFDAALALLVAASIATGRRPRNPRNLALLAGFMLMTFADSPPAAAWSLGEPNHRLLINATWAAGLAAVVWGGTIAERHPRRHAGGGGSAAGWSAVLGLIAITALLLRPAQMALYVTIPAGLTLVFTQARLVIALREARGASEAKRMSFTDALTQLPNRRAVDRLLEQAWSTRDPIAVMMLDLNDFKAINDGLGHAAGDEVLRETATRLRGAVPDDVVVARLSGDEFALVVHEGDEEALLARGRAVLEALGRPAQVAERGVTIRGALGIAVRSADHETPEELLRRADVAMYVAKADGAGAALYREQSDPFSRARRAKVAALRGAVRTGNIQAWYQPQVDAITGEVVAVEALARWCGPGGEFVMTPDEFLPIARRDGLMTELSCSVAAQAVRDVAAWRAQGRAQRVSINIDPAELLGGIFVPYLLSLVDAARLPAGTVVVEITEESFASGGERAHEVLHDLAAHGVAVSIDDYGTGFASLAHLRNLPVAELKIDRSFIVDITTDARARTIVEFTTRMAHDLGMRVVAEGVEDRAAALLLRDVHVDVLQGFWTSQALPGADLPGWLDAHHATPPAGDGAGVTCGRTTS